MIEAFLPAVDGIGCQAVRAAQFSDGLASLPLLKDGGPLPGGKTAAQSAFGWWVLDICIRLIMPFKLSKS